MKSPAIVLVARRFRHRAVVGIHDGVSQQDERQMLPVVRWRALLSYRWHERRPHLQRLAPAPQFRAPDRAMCARKSQCLQSGVYVGPYSGRHFAGMQKM